MLKFVKQIEINLSIYPKKTEGATNRSEMGGVERLFNKQRIHNPRSEHENKEIIEKLREF